MLLNIYLRDFLRLCGVTLLLSEPRRSFYTEQTDRCHLTDHSGFLIQKDTAVFIAKYAIYHNSLYTRFFLKKKEYINFVPKSVRRPSVRLSVRLCGCASLRMCVRVDVHPSRYL